MVADLRTNFSSWSRSDLRCETVETAQTTFFRAPFRWALQDCSYPEIREESKSLSLILSYFSAPWGEDER